MTPRSCIKAQVAHGIPAVFLSTRNKSMARTPCATFHDPTTRRHDDQTIQMWCRVVLSSGRLVRHSLSPSKVRQTFLSAGWQTAQTGMSAPPYHDTTTRQSKRGVVSSCRQVVLSVIPSKVRQTFLSAGWQNAQTGMSAPPYHDRTTRQSKRGVASSCRQAVLSVILSLRATLSLSFSAAGRSCRRSQTTKRKPS